jgi:hypothetical protein
MLSNPLKRVILRNKALDYFRFAIGPQNIDRPARSGIFPCPESWSLLRHPFEYAPMPPRYSSQLSRHNQTDPLPSRWSIAAPERVADAGLVRGLQRGADRPLKTNRAAPFSLGTCCTAQFSRNRKAIIPVYVLRQARAGAPMTQQDRWWFAISIVWFFLTLGVLLYLGFA